MNLKDFPELREAISSDDFIILELLSDISIEPGLNLTDLQGLIADAYSYALYLKKENNL